MKTQACSCDCHGHGKFGTCSIEGGCGHLHVEHRCAQDKFCALKAPERDASGKPTGKWLPQVIEIERGLCRACTSRVGKAVSALAEDALILTFLLGDQGTASEVCVAASPELRVPVRLTIEALRADIDTELTAWAEPVADKLGIEWDTADMTRTRIMPRIVRAVHLLRSAVPTLLALPEQDHPAWADGMPVRDAEGRQRYLARDGVAGALSLLELHRRAYAATGRTHLVHRLPTPCPWCDHRTLVRHNGQSHVECENCAHTVEEKLYDWFVGASLAAQQSRPAA
jgi:hypothetical protein